MTTCETKISYLPTKFWKHLSFRKSQLFHKMFEHSNTIISTKRFNTNALICVVCDGEKHSLSLSYCCRVFPIVIDPWRALCEIDTSYHLLYPVNAQYVFGKRNLFNSYAYTHIHTRSTVIHTYRHVYGGMRWW